MASRRKEKNQNKKKIKIRCSECGIILTHIVSKAIGKCGEHRTIEDMENYFKRKAEVKDNENKNNLGSKK